MGFISNALSKRAAKSDSFNPGQEPPTAWTEDWGWSTSGANVILTAAQSLQISAVFACVRNIAEDCASLPLIMYRRLPGGGKERAPEHRLYKTLHDLPNPEMTAMDMRTAMGGHLGTWGNAFSYLEPDGAGGIKEIWPLRPDYMFLYRNPATLELYYEYYIPSVNVKYTWPMEKIFHVRGFGDGILGYSPTRMQMRSQGLAWATEEFGAKFFGNGARPGIVLKHPGQLSDNALRHVKESWEERHTGLEKSHRVAILEEGMDLQTVGVPPDEAQFLETRKFQVSEIARWYRMPPHMIGDLEKATFSNIEQQSLEYVTRTLRPWLIRWEQEISRSLLLARERGTFFAEHLVDGMLRGDITSRYGAYAVAVQNGWMNRNEVRERENMNTAPGLDEFQTPLNMGTVGARALSLLRPVVEDVTARVMRRQASDIRSAWAKIGPGEAWRTWLSGFEPEWNGKMHEMILPVMRSYAELMNRDEAWASRLTLRIVRGWWQESDMRLTSDGEHPEDIFVEWQTVGSTVLAARMMTEISEAQARQEEEHE
jgi:HK97 family phage portal protein